MTGFEPGNTLQHHRPRREGGILCPTPQTVCSVCGIPGDAQVFDDAGFLDDLAELKPGELHTLAGFALQPQYCGVLQYFAQFTDAHAKDPSQVATPTLEWSIRANGQPLSPYLRMRAILNPWGYGSFAVARRLPDGALIELVVKRVGTPSSTDNLKRVGGRIVGKYWYNSIYGERERGFGA